MIYGSASATNVVDLNALSAAQGFRVDGARGGDEETDGDESGGSVGGRVMSTATGAST